MLKKQSTCYPIKLFYTNLLIKYHLVEFVFNIYNLQQLVAFEIFCIEFVRILHLFLYYSTMQCLEMQIITIFFIS